MSRGKLQLFGSTTYPTALDSTQINFEYNSSLEFNVGIYETIVCFSTIPLYAKPILLSQVKVLIIV